MRYDGKSPQDMTTDELHDAIQYVASVMLQAQAVYELNEAGAIELSEELAKRGRVLN